MHKNFRNSNKIHPVIADILKSNNGRFTFENRPILPSHESKIFNFFESENVQNLIEKRVNLIGKILPIKEDKIKERLLNFIKKNRVATRYEQACCRYIKQFNTTAFLICETCEMSQNDLQWIRCKNCGSFNKYRI